jgi:hypothetical protein
MAVERVIAAAGMSLRGRGNAGAPVDGALLKRLPTLLDPGAATPAPGFLCPHEWDLPKPFTLSAGRRPESKGTPVMAIPQGWRFDSARCAGYAQRERMGSRPGFNQAAPAMAARIAAISAA